MNYHSPLSESFLAVLQAATKLAEQSVVPNFVNLAPSSETLKIAISLAGQAQHRLAVLETVQKQNAALQRLLIKLEWPPPWHLPAVLLDRIVEAHESGNFSEEEITQLFIDLYGPERLKELLRKWKQSEHIGRRATILDEGIQNHLDCRFFSSVCIFSMQIEGVIGEALGRQPNPKNDADTILTIQRFRRLPATFTSKWLMNRSPGPVVLQSPNCQGMRSSTGETQNSVQPAIHYE